MYRRCGMRGDCDRGSECVAKASCPGLELKLADLISDGNLVTGTKESDL